MCACVFVCLSALVDLDITLEDCTVKLQEALILLLLSIDAVDEFVFIM